MMLKQEIAKYILFAWLVRSPVMASCPLELWQGHDPWINSSLDIAS